LGKMAVAESLKLCGQLAFHQGDYVKARAYYDESYALTNEMGLWSIVKIGYIHLREGNLAGAFDIFAESQQRFQQAEDKVGVVYCLEGLASLWTAKGDEDTTNVRYGQIATQLYAWADVMRKTIKNSRPPIEQADMERELARIRLYLDETVFSAATAAGQAMTPEEAVALALEAGQPIARAWR